ncbi:MAG: ChaN family lipoprotein, partial [Myxococcales bacterium]|nr:ChaN family lipoprotein [Myxococcales bacterium]
MKIFVIAAFVVAGCAHAPSPAATQPKAEEAPRHGDKGAKEPIALPHRVVDGDSGDELADRNLDDKLRAAKVIYVGEEHPNPHHHAVELEVLERAYAADPSVGLGMEMLPRTYQGSLDAYVGGSLDEPGFLAAVAWDKTWGYAWGFYRPLLEFCRAHKLPAYALNAPRDLAHAVAKSGIDGLSPAERAELPEMKPGPAKHRELVREAFAQHPHAKFDEAKFERFYAAQLVWDETMAERVAAALKTPGAPARLVVVAGEGHTRSFAIPERAARRGAAPYLTVLPVLDDDAADARRDRVADVLW